MRATLWALGILSALLWAAFGYGVYWAGGQGHNYGAMMPVLLDGGMALIVTGMWFILWVIYTLLGKD